MVSTAPSVAVSVALRARSVSHTMAALPGTIIIDANFLVRISVFIPDRPEAKHGQRLRYVAGTIGRGTPRCSEPP